MAARSIFLSYRKYFQYPQDCSCNYHQHESGITTNHKTQKAEELLKVIGKRPTLMAL